MRARGPFQQRFGYGGRARRGALTIFGGGALEALGCSAGCGAVGGGRGLAAVAGEREKGNVDCLRLDFPHHPPIIRHGARECISRLFPHTHVWSTRSARVNGERERAQTEPPAAAPPLFYLHAAGKSSPLASLPLLPRRPSTPTPATSAPTRRSSRPSTMASPWCVAGTAVPGPRGEARFESLPRGGKPRGGPTRQPSVCPHGRGVPAPGPLLVRLTDADT